MSMQSSLSCPDIEVCTSAGMGLGSYRRYKTYCIHAIALFLVGNRHDGEPGEGKTGWHKRGVK